MGSDGKSKKRRSTSISEDEGRSKKHRTRDERERKKVKSDKEEKTKSKKSHKHSKRHSDKGKKSKEKHGKKHHRDRPSFEELSNDDYFSKNNEFATWLKEERGLFFSDLSSDAARELFQHFVKDWNSQKLELRYYEGITSGPRTRHDWKITDAK